MEKNFGGLIENAISNYLSEGMRDKKSGDADVVAAKDAGWFKTDKLVNIVEGLQKNDWHKTLVVGTLTVIDSNRDTDIALLLTYTNETSVSGKGIFKRGFGKSHTMMLKSGSGYSKTTYLFTPNGEVLISENAIKTNGKVDMNKKVAFYKI